MFGRTWSKHFTSPDSVWVIEIGGPTEVAPAFMASVFHNGIETMSFPFGYDVFPDQLSVRWDLPNNACGMYLGDHCYAMFRWGARHRRNRELYHTGRDRFFSDEEIARFCAKNRSQNVHRT